MKKYILLFLAAVLLSGCATADPNRFGRADGAYRGVMFVKYDLPEFYGKVPAEYPYKSLGQVEGRCKKQSLAGVLLARKGLVVQMIEAQQECIAKAKALGANAILNMRFPSKRAGKDCLTVGEAVVFEHVPTKKEVEEYELKRTQEHR
ncbi:MAG: lipoprotein [Candidatus Omnitrophota bacterium]